MTEPNIPPSGNAALEAFKAMVEVPSFQLGLAVGIMAGVAVCTMVVVLSRLGLI